MLTPRHAVTLDAMTAELDRVIAHFSGMNIELGKGRILELREMLGQAASGIPVSAKDLGHALCEAHDLSKSANLSHTTLERVRPRLREIASGLSVQSGADQGRDLLFELATAEYFQQAEPVMLDCPSDVVACSAVPHTLIECKRPTTANAFGDRVRDAYRQLSNHRRNGHVGLGIVAVDLSLYINPAAIPLPDQPIDQAVHSLNIYLNRAIASARDKLRRSMGNARRDARVGAMLFYARASVRPVPESMAVVACWQWRVVASEPADVGLAEAFIERHPTTT